MIMRVGGYQRWFEWLIGSCDADGGLEALCDGGQDGGGIVLDGPLRGRGRGLAEDGGGGEEEGGDDNAMVAEGGHLEEGVVSEWCYRKNDVTIDDDQVTIWDDASPGLLSCAVGTPLLSILSSALSSEFLYPFHV